MLSTVKGSDRDANDGWQECENDRELNLSSSDPKPDSIIQPRADKCSALPCCLFQ